MVNLHIFLFDNLLDNFSWIQKSRNELKVQSIRWKFLIIKLDLILSPREPIKTFQDLKTTSEGQGMPWLIYVILKLDLGSQNQRTRSYTCCLFNYFHEMN